MQFKLNFLFVSSNLQYFYDSQTFNLIPTSKYINNHSIPTSKYTEKNQTNPFIFQHDSRFTFSDSDKEYLLILLHNEENLSDDVVSTDIHLNGFVFRWLTPFFYFALRQKFSILKKLFLGGKIAENDYKSLYSNFEIIHNYLQVTYSNEFIISEYERFLKTYSKTNTYPFAIYDPTRDLLKRSSRVA